jgi:hypothetical protein
VPVIAVFFSVAAAPAPAQQPESNAVWHGVLRNPAGARETSRFKTPWSPIEARAGAALIVQSPYEGRWPANQSIALIMTD